MSQDIPPSSSSPGRSDGPSPSNGEPGEEKSEPLPSILPQGQCRICGATLRYRWETEPYLIRFAQAEGPFWAEQSCEACEARAWRPANLRTDDGIRQALKNAQIGERFLDCSFSNYRIISKKNPEGQRQAMAACQAYGLNIHESYQRGAWLAMLGGNGTGPSGFGTGKGHLSAAILREAARHRYTIAFTTAWDLFRELKASWHQGSEEDEHRIIARYCRVDFLVIDEIGVGFGSTTEQNFLYAVLDGRYKERKPLIFTSNESWNRFRELLGPRNEDRFHHGGKVLIFDWESFRKG